ncbi:MAG: hypothetical protein ACREQR_12200 [Candidatus Binataceae bacterium]
MTVEEYLDIRTKVMAHPNGRAEIEWLRKAGRPKDSNDLALRLASVVTSSGFEYRPELWERIGSALRRGRRIFPDVFGNKNKAAAIEKIWRDRRALFTTFKAIHTPQEALKWCEGIPYVQGPVLRYQAVRDLGVADVAKPDRHLERIAERAGEFLNELSKRLARSTGDSVGMVDMVLWNGARLRIIPGISRRRGRVADCQPRARASRRR